MVELSSFQLVKSSGKARFSMPVWAAQGQRRQPTVEQMRREIDVGLQFPVAR
jgi:hypothetical protein